MKCTKCDSQSFTETTDGIVEFRTFKFNPAKKKYECASLNSDCNGEVLWECENGHAMAPAEEAKLSKLIDFTTV